MDVVLVPTTHWDREWYRTFQAFRARLVDTVDRVLELLAADEGYTFLLDGQSIVLEDYVEVRPGRREELERHIRDGRVEIGPWYVQPDSLIPSGESHVRNLLEGRRAGETFGPVTRVAYTPDSFGHPAQFPQIFSGFGLDHFVYWRGNSDEIAELPAEYAWEAPDGTRVIACHLWETYSNAAGLGAEMDRAVKRVTTVVEKLAPRTRSGRVLLLAGTDHQPPEAGTDEICAAVADATGWTVRRGLLGGFVEGLVDRPEELPVFRGELVGGRIANLLPGVWSTRTYLKVRNRRCEAALERWAEPWSALARMLGAPDERPALRLAWRQLLANQAHDSICGCSQDAVHEQMLARYDAAEELARETTRRACERIAGLGVERRVPWSDEIDIAVFNPSAHARTDVVRFPLQGYPPFDQSQRYFIHPLNWANMRTAGFTVDGEPARLVPIDTNDRVRIINEQQDFDVEFVAADVPAFGYRRFRLRPSEAVDDEEDDGREISAGDVAVVAAEDGTLTVRFGSQSYSGLFALEDIGDRGDTYDFDPVDAGGPGGAAPPVRAGGPGGAAPPVRWQAETVGRPQVSRARHSNGIQHLSIHRVLQIPRLDEARSAPAGPGSFCDLRTVVRVAPNVPRIDLSVQIRNHAPDHRLRALFPTGVPVQTFSAATTFDIAERSTAARDAGAWIHPAPTTFPHQGWVSANGLTVVAPGLLEGEVTPDGIIAITLLRAVGWLSRMDLRTRPSHAGPALATPGAQCLRTFDARFALLPGLDPRGAHDAEAGLAATALGETPLWPAGTSLISVEPREVLVSALKPADDGEGIVLRLLNPTEDVQPAVVHFGFDVSTAAAVPLDEARAEGVVSIADGAISLEVPPHALRSVLVMPK